MEPTADQNYPTFPSGSYEDRRDRIMAEHSRLIQESVDIIESRDAESDRPTLPSDETREYSQSLGRLHRSRPGNGQSGLPGPDGISLEGAAQEAASRHARMAAATEEFIRGLDERRDMRSQYYMRNRTTAATAPLGQSNLCEEIVPPEFQPSGLDEIRREVLELKEENKRLQERVEVLERWKEV